VQGSFNTARALLAAYPISSRPCLPILTLLETLGAFAKFSCKERVLIILGKPIIALWMGSRYVSASYPVLVIMALGSSLYTLQGPSFRILYGMARHRWMAVVRLCEGCAVILLSVLLVRHFGIVGVALGTAIPLACSSLFFYPLYLCRLLKTSLVQYLAQTYLLPLALCAPMILAVVLLRQLFPRAEYSTMFVQIACGALTYGIAFGWFFFTQEPFGIQMRKRATQFVRQANTH